MPKQALRIGKFHGGLNTALDNTDIADNELSEATDVMVDEIGRVRTLGGMVSWGPSADQLNHSGYGSFQFSHDKDGAELGHGTVGSDSPTDYIVHGAGTGNVKLYSSETSNWGSAIAELDFESDSSGGKPNFYNVDGALRIANENFSNDIANKWYGHIDRTLFKSQASADQFTINQWVATDQEPAAPPVSGNVFYSNLAEDTWKQQISESPNYIAILLQEDGAGDPIIDFYKKKWNVGVSYAYDEGIRTKQHSPITPISMFKDSPVSSGIRIFDCTDFDNNPEMRWGIVYSNAYPWTNKRITGHLLWIREASDDDGASDSDWFLISENDWIEGLAKNYVASTDKTVETKFELETGTGISFLENSTEGDAEEMATIPQITYFSRFGYKANSVISAQYKTAVSLNRAIYIGNVKQNGVVHGDRMIKSPVNMPDVFPESRIIDAVISDGDDIIKLETYADRVLQFKKNKLLIWHVSQDSEGLEDTFLYKGVSHPAATCKTDYGIAWVNRFGCYLYNGENVINLLEKEGKKLIKDSEWNVFTANQPMIGYLPKKRQLIVVDYWSYGNIFLYDMVTQSWVKGANGTFGSSIAKSNFITDWNGDLVFSQDSGLMYKWDDESKASAGIDLKTKMTDFGRPGQTKKIYRVMVTHKYAGDPSTVELRGEIMSRSATSGQEEGALSNNFKLGDLTQDVDQAENWITQVFEMPTLDHWNEPISFNNVYKIRLYIESTGTSEAGFSINDISIAYKVKPVK